MIENIKTIKKVDQNILPFIQHIVTPKKYQKLQNFMVENGVWGTEKYLIHHIGTRENTDTPVVVFQMGFEDQPDDLWIVVEEDELK